MQSSALSSIDGMKDIARGGLLCSSLRDMKE